MGVICNKGHEVFAEVARRLRDRGVAVRFFEPGRSVEAGDLDDLTLLMNKKVDPHSFRALRRAESRGIRTWNGTTTMVLGARLVGYSVLEEAGARVPPVHFEGPDGDYVAKTHYDWHFQPDPELNGEGDVYQELVEADPVDLKYYAVDTGDEVVVRVLRVTSKLHGEKKPLGFESPAPGPAEQVREVMRLTDTQAIGVDFVRSDGDLFAVDVNPAMSFRGAKMEDELVESVFAVLPDEEGASESAGTTVPGPGSVPDDGENFAHGRPVHESGRDAEPPPTMTDRNANVEVSDPEGPVD